jgi:predicted acylesterase/phospholipase RssA
MHIPKWFKHLLLALTAQIAVSGCSTPSRLPAAPESASAQIGSEPSTVRFLVSRETDSFAREAQNALSREKAWLASQGQSGPLPPAYYLAISGGGDNGAFGAGFLNGWTAAGTRPEFKAVTGVSTGALIAPFAFLGPKYDYVLEKVYTTSSQRDIFKKRGLLKGVLGDGMADTRPLANLIASYVNQEFLDEIAQQSARGRLLLVGTTNLDSLEPVIWDMTAIASSKAPNAISLFRSILLASASIPGAFPPVMIDVNVDGTRHAEMHVDGGAMAQVFLYPSSHQFSDSDPALQRERTLYIIRNARLDGDWASVERRTLPIASRAIASLTRTQGIGDLYRIYLLARRDDIDFNLAFIPASFNAPHREEFDTDYMKALFATGKQMAQTGYQWQKYPPGFVPDKGP